MTRTLAALLVVGMTKEDEMPYHQILDAQIQMTRREVIQIIGELLRAKDELARENRSLRRALEEQWGCECRTDDPPEHYA